MCAEINWESLGIDRSTYDRHIFVSADKDGDHRVSFQEFWEFVLKNLQHKAHEQAIAASKQVRFHAASPSPRSAAASVPRTQKKRVAETLTPMLSSRVGLGVFVPSLFSSLDLCDYPLQRRRSSLH